MTDIVERLRATTEEMAHEASVSMMLWDRHSNACLEAADEIERLRAANTELQGIDATLQLALERAQRERDEARALAIHHSADVAREYAAAVIAGHGHIPTDPVEAMTKAAQEIEAAILWQLAPPPEGKP